MEMFCYYTTKILQYFVHKLQCVLRKTTNHTTENYRLYYTKLQIVLHKLQIVLHKTTDCTTQNYKSCYKYLDRSYYIKYTYLHTGIHANYIVILHIQNYLRSYTCTDMGSIAQNLATA